MLCFIKTLCNRKWVEYSPQCTRPPSHPALPHPEGSGHPQGPPSVSWRSHFVDPPARWQIVCCWTPASHGSGWRGHWAVSPKTSGTSFGFSFSINSTDNSTLTIYSVFNLLCATAACRPDIHHMLEVPVGRGTLPLHQAWLCKPRSSSLQSPSSSPSAHWGAAWLCAEDPAAKKTD